MKWLLAAKDKPMQDWMHLTIDEVPYCISTKSNNIKFEGKEAGDLALLLHEYRHRERLATTAKDVFRAAQGQEADCPDDWSVAIGSKSIKLSWDGYITSVPSKGSKKSSPKKKAKSKPAAKKDSGKAKADKKDKKDKKAKDDKAKADKKKKEAKEKDKKKKGMKKRSDWFVSASKGNEKKEIAQAKKLLSGIRSLQSREAKEGDSHAASVLKRAGDLIAKFIEIETKELAKSSMWHRSDNYISEAKRIVGKYFLEITHEAGDATGPEGQEGWDMHPSRVVEVMNKRMKQLEEFEGTAPESIGNILEDMVSMYKKLDLLEEKFKQDRQKAKKDAETNTANAECAHAESKDEECAQCALTEFKEDQALADTKSDDGKTLPGNRSEEDAKKGKDPRRIEVGDEKALWHAMQKKKKKDSASADMDKIEEGVKKMKEGQEAMEEGQKSDGPAALSDMSKTDATDWKKKKQEAIMSARVKVGDSVWRRDLDSMIGEVPGRVVAEGGGKLIVDWGGVDCIPEEEDPENLVVANVEGDWEDSLFHARSENAGLEEEKYDDLEESSSLEQEAEDILKTLSMKDRKNKLEASEKPAEISDIVHLGTGKKGTLVAHLTDGRCLVRFDNKEKFLWPFEFQASQMSPDVPSAGSHLFEL